MNRSTTRSLGLVALILLATFAAYAPVLQTDTRFLWDDDSELWGSRGHLVQDSDGILKAWLPLQRPEGRDYAAWEWEAAPGQGFWPLTPTVFWLEWRLFGADERWASSENRSEQIEAVEQIANRFHLPNVLLHALNAILLWLVLARLGVPASAWIGLFFALHPLGVPSVAWVSELKNALSLFLLLLSFDTFLRHEEHPRLALRIGSLALFFLSLTAKAAAVGFPFVLLGAIWWRNGSLPRRELLRVAPYFLLSLAMGLATLWFTRESGGVTELVRGPENFWHALAGAGWIPFFYAWKTLVPLDLMMIYPRLDVPWRSPASYLPSLVIALLLALAWLKRQRWGRGPFFALTATGALLSPVLGFFEMTFMMHSEVSDHFHYLSIIPMLALVVGGVASWVSTRPALRIPARIAGVCLLLVLGMMTHERARLFKGHIELWSDNVRRNPEAWMAEYNLGASLLLEANQIESRDVRQGVLAWALGHLERAVELQPTYARAHYELGHALSRLDDDAGAVDALRTALELELTSGPMATEEEAIRRLQIGRASRRLRRFEDARADLQLSTDLWPGRPLAHFELGLTLLRLDDERGATDEFERTISADPRHFKAHIRLAMLYAAALDDSIRDGDAAMVHAREAEQLAPPGVKSKLMVLSALAAAHAERGVSDPQIREEEFEAATALAGEAMETALQANDVRAFKLAAYRSRIYSSGHALRRRAGR
jgi:tetratricopeptide (TPR) repeat protein